MKSSLMSLLIASSFLAHGSMLSSMDMGSMRKDVYSGISFQYFDQKDRVQVLEDLFRSIELEYAPLKIKEKRIGLNFKKIKEEAISAELAISDLLLESKDRGNAISVKVGAIVQGQLNMDFLDRVDAVVAKFKDTHFSVHARVPRPVIYNGLRFRRLGDKVVLGSVDPKLLSLLTKLTGTDFSTLKALDEILSIDGVPVQEKINELKAHISCSSDDFCDTEAIRELTYRDHLYPTRNYNYIAFKNGGFFKIPFFYKFSASSIQRQDAYTYLQSLGMQTDTTAIGLTYDQEKHKWNDSDINFVGYSPDKLHLNLKGVKIFADDTGNPGLRTGYFFKEGKAYAVMQILTFYTQNLKSDSGEAKSFIDTIRDFLTEVKNSKMPLVIDLRLNGGGNGSFPGKVLSLLAPVNTIYPGPSVGMRITSYSRQLTDIETFQIINAENLTEGMPLDLYTNLINDAINAHKDYTPMFSYGDILTDKILGGMDNKIVALVTPNCISACDNFASLLKTTGRATIIGTHSNGTGAGFSSDGEFTPDWTDSFKLLTAKIPNHLFGLTSSPGELIMAEDSAYDLDLENKPTVADVPYNYSELDLSKSNLGWINIAVETLDKLK